MAGNLPAGASKERYPGEGVNQCLGAGQQQMMATGEVCPFVGEYGCHVPAPQRRQSTAGDHNQTATTGYAVGGGFVVPDDKHTQLAILAADEQNSTPMLRTAAPAEKQHACCAVPDPDEDQTGREQTSESDQGPWCRRCGMAGEQFGACCQ